MKCKCGKSMKIRTNKKDGNKFWGCTGYPRCKHTKSIDQAKPEPPKRHTDPTVAIKRIKHEQYNLYLESSQWKKKRQAVLKRDEHTCRICGSKDNLQVHHITYDRIYNESPYDLVTVCTACHKHIHA